MVFVLVVDCDSVGCVFIDVSAVGVVSTWLPFAVVVSTFVVIGGISVLTVAFDDIGGGSGGVVVVGTVFSVALSLIHHHSVQERLKNRQMSCVISKNIAYVTYEDVDQPEYPRPLINSFFVLCLG